MPDSISNSSGTGSNSSGTGHDPQADETHPEYAESDPVTEVIDVVVADTGSGPTSAEAAAAEERRFTAPGFDAGSTQIIDRVPDPPTEFIITPTEPVDTSRPRTGPQEIPPARPARPRWLRPAVVAVAALLVIAALVGAFLWQRSAAQASRENMVRTTIETFDTAVRDGDLATLRTVTCGETRQNYDDYDQQAWKDTYAKVAAARQYPVVASIDQVVVNGDHAEANVTSYMAYDPAITSVRSFDLQFRDDHWQICQAS